MSLQSWDPAAGIRYRRRAATRLQTVQGAPVTGGFRRTPPFALGSTTQLDCRSLQRVWIAMTEDHNPYAVLGVTPAATPAEINFAFRAKLRSLHPDTRDRDRAGAAGDTQLHQLIAAYHLLRNPEHRAEHDRKAAAASAPRRQQRPRPSPPRPGTASPEEPLTIPVTHHNRSRAPDADYLLWAGPVRRHR